MNGNLAKIDVLSELGENSQQKLTRWDDVPLVMELDMAAAIMLISVEHLRYRCRKGVFPAFKDGRRWLISKAALMRHVGATGQF